MDEEKIKNRIIELKKELKLLENELHKCQPKMKDNVLSDEEFKEKYQLKLNELIFTKQYNIILVHMYEVKRGMYIILNNQPCRIIDVKRSMASKSSKCMIEGINILTDEKEVLVQYIYKNGPKLFLTFDPIKEQVKIIDFKKEENNYVFECLSEDGSTKKIIVKYFNEDNIHTNLHKNTIGCFIHTLIQIKDFNTNLNDLTDTAFENCVRFNGWVQ